MADGLKLSVLLPDRLDRMGEQARKKLCETEEIGCMKLAWDYIAGELDAALKAALDCDLLEILAKIWAESDLFSEFADLRKHPPGTRSVIEIGKHELKRELHPIVGVTIGSLPCVELKFTLALRAHFGGVKLSILDGHIIGGGTGDAWASAELSYAGTSLHEASDSKKLPIPGRFGFDAPGIRIPWVQPAAEKAEAVASGA